ncbi:hypothetical protein GUJ93_ZPchr0004g38222 [Zizania palustris]|uniref:Enoyl reductase (ER) domain-containing protein n=1 Tax=Zizania palustris TaxID=103762 RepID=A0A8J5V7Z3_ZIZPA|nr:hypothetical protein GUJ93_ZPchr0004g38222 [Zizania palustris]
MAGAGAGAGAGAAATPANMRAVQYGAYGGGAAGLKHVEVPIPSAKKNELLLKLDAATINPVDWKIQKGVLRPLLPLKLPFIPGTDVAGVVAHVGPGVKDFMVGDQVVAMLNSLYGGAFAEYAVASVNLTVKRPPELAKLANLHVTATCGARNVELVKSLGADEVLDYRTPEGASMRSPSGRKYDGVVHCTVGVSWASFEPLMSAAGRVIDITPNFSSMLTSALHMVTLRKKRLVPLLLSPNKADLEFLVGLVKEGKLKTVVDSSFPLNDLTQAWQKSIDGHATGKIVVEMKA